MTRIIWVALAATAAATAVSGHAQDPVAAARSGGTVGERFDGYLGIVGDPGDSVRRQVAAINIKRRSLYSSLAARKGVSPQEVGLTAACTTLSRVAIGELYFTQSGGWRRRDAGQAAPVPAYCTQ
ncbi:YdbL family protein [Sphingomonas jaspsi]|uniref:YdbL family protein n=1 Tax=Sphingomonas jaspsi TaxID=392409 RepID=UPI0004AF47F2|nr:YdbL family protein [Sphingomonas jaspsi]